MIKISKILHVGDVHIRNFKRHKEYRDVFKKLFKYIESIKDDETAIYLAGDIVHSKTDMTPELVDLVSYFLKSCADLCPTILICGNHDTNLNNSNRLDALTPIVDTLDHKNLHYWKDTGVYYLGDIAFSVYSVFGSPLNWVKAKDIDFDGTKIALHHGSVTGALTDLDHTINNEFVKTDIFSGYEYALLGDIHKRQFLDVNNRIHYCGSLVQQNHGEILEKGITVWDLKNKSSEFVRIPNDIGYVTLQVKDGKVYSDKDYVQSWPKKIRLRVKYENTTKEQLQSIIAVIKQRNTVEELVISKNNSLELLKNDTTVLDDVRDIEYQNKLITEYLESKNILTVESDYLRHLNRTINSDLNSNIKLIRNIKWKPKVLEFSNMFSYGPNNVINFEKLKGIQGLFAQNAQGKSSLLDVFTYCIYDKCSRAWKAKDVLNNQKTRFKCKLQLELNDELYTIERSGFLDSKKGTVKVEVEFSKVDLDGVKHSLNGDDRDQTNKLIRDYLGTYDDFLLTTLSTQNDNKNFIFKTQRERKELLYSFLDLSVFEDLQTIAKKSIKDKSDSLSIAETEYYSSDLSNLQLNYDKYTKELAEVKDKNNIAEIKIQDIQNNIDRSNKRFIPTIKIIDWTTDQDSELDKKTKELNLFNEKILKYETELSSIDSKITECQEEISKIDINLVNEKTKFISKIREEIEDQNTKKEDIQTEINKVNILIEKLKTYEFDPECKYCVQNQFVQDAYTATNQLPNLVQSIKDIDIEIGLKQKQIDDLLLYNDLHNTYSINHSALTHWKSERSNLIETHLKDIKKFDSLKEAVNNLQSLKEQYYKNKDQIAFNKGIELLRQKFENELEEVKKEHNKLQSSIIDLSTKIQIQESKIQRREDLKLKIDELQKTVESYNVYIEMMSNDGIPYMILQKILPVIENEVNLILSEVVDFTSKFESDEKNNINCYLLYTNDNIWPVEMASGMERFIISLAIRCALVDITNLPRPVFMAIDEGFGVLDSEKISSMTLLFDYMRNKFDFIIAVSHVDTMRDMVDGLIDVHKNKQGFSEVMLN